MSPLFVRVGKHGSQALSVLVGEAWVISPLCMSRESMSPEPSHCVRVGEAWVMSPLIVYESKCSTSISWLINQYHPVMSLNYTTKVLHLCSITILSARKVGNFYFFKHFFRNIYFLNIFWNTCPYCFFTLLL